MKKELSRTEARTAVDHFFEKTSFTAHEAKKIKRLAMKYKIRLGKYRKRFCKACYADLRKCSVRVTKTHMLATCLCGHQNRIKLS